MTIELASALAGSLAGYLVGKLDRPPSDADIIEYLRQVKPRFFEDISIDTSVAHTNEPYKVIGNFVFVENPDTPTTSVYVRFNDSEGHKIDLTKQRHIKAPFYQFFVTNEAGSGTLNLVVGKGYGFEVTEATVDVNITAQVANIDVTVAGTANISITAQTVGVHLQPEWAVTQSEDKTFELGSPFDSYGDFDSLDYTVPSDKTLYISMASFQIYGYDVDIAETFHNCIFYVYDYDTGDFLDRTSSNDGRTTVYPMPLEIPGGHKMELFIQSKCNHKVMALAVVRGYEV